MAGSVGCGYCVALLVMHLPNSNPGTHRWFFLGNGEPLHHHGPLALVIYSIPFCQHTIDRFCLFVCHLLHSVVSIGFVYIRTHSNRTKWIVFRVSPLNLTLNNSSHRNVNNIFAPNRMHVVKIKKQMQLKTVRCAEKRSSCIGHGPDNNNNNKNQAERRRRRRKNVCGFSTIVPAVYLHMDKVFVYAFAGRTKLQRNL